MNQLLLILAHPRVTSRVRRFVAVGGTLLAAKIPDPGLQVAALAIMTEVLEVWAAMEDRGVAAKAGEEVFKSINPPPLSPPTQEPSA